MRSFHLKAIKDQHNKQVETNHNPNKSHVT